ncbi:DEAD/DEAH box helicase [Aldersonia sp. NBC_00410]|uniref:SNF2-related protein n=1 Tax=Aldersonia sp. NBC_00410 TaxID=2975954 RepID=UPI002253E955|nr:DEAD/DEAH box helicase [Aldersonia sp. NBC_00410]MCX5046697.1 DEAD/DEAH box helicase [Aldersonia sp. NBC_00410]
MSPAARLAGTLRWVGSDPGWWQVDAEPDVMVRLKRVFPRVQGTRSGAFRIAATDEVARDLEWVMSRWRLKASRADLNRLRKGCEQHRRREAAVLAVLDGQARTRGTEGWVRSAVQLRPYQLQARDLVHATRGALIVDDLGLGKTASGLSVLEDPAARPALAVTLTALPKQWLRELAKFYPDLSGFEITTRTPLPADGSGPGQDGLFEVDGAPQLPDADLYVMNYAKLQKWQHHLAGRVRTVIFDEAQELRRFDSEKYRAAAHIAGKADYTAGLTGTPCYNFGGELYNILDVLRPGSLGSRDEFAREWCKLSFGLDQKTRIADPDAFRTHLRAQGLMLRRTRADVGVHLPPIETIEQYVPSDASVLERIDGDAVEMARLILDQTANHQQRWQAAGDLDWRMRQGTGIAKAPFVADFVKLLLETEQRILLFGWHRAVYDLWLERLAGFGPRLFTGTESPAAKQRAIDEFTGGECRVLIMSLRSGAGIDGLQGATSTVVFGELDWSHGVHRQCIGRVARPGQTRGVSAYFCCTDAGADPVMIDVLNLKAMETDAIVDAVRDTTLNPVTNTERVKLLARAVLDRRTDTEGVA